MLAPKVMHKKKERNTLKGLCKSNSLSTGCCHAFVGCIHYFKANVKCLSRTHRPQTNVVQVIHVCMGTSAAVFVSHIVSTILLALSLYLLRFQPIVAKFYTGIFEARSVHLVCLFVFFCKSKIPIEIKKWHIEI